MNFKNDVFIVSGASSGIGKGCVELLLEKDATVIGFDITDSLIHHEKYSHSVVDVRNEDSIEILVDDAVKKYKKISGLVNCAGINAIKKPFYELSLKEWNNSLEINLTGTFILSKSVTRHMIIQGRGKIVNISCIRTKIFKKNIAEYATTKGGVVALTSSMAIDLAPYGIQVNSVAPGLTYTNILRNVFEKNEGVEADYVNMIPQNRIADPIDIAKVVIFLLSNESSYITGQTIYVDGGMSISK